MPEINIESIQSAVTGANKNPIGTDRGIDMNNVPTPEIIYTRALYLLIWAVGVIAVLVIVYSGFTYMTAGGDAEKAERAKKMLMGTVIGILIIIGSYMIYNSIIEGTQTGKISGEIVQQILREV